jgi:hypothetical protein
MILCQKEIINNTYHYLERGYKNMRKIVYSMFIIMILFIWSMLLVSCKAIIAQNINIDSAGGMNGGPGRNGNLGMNGSPRMNGKTSNNENFMGGMTNADLMGKIISVDGNSIKIEVIKQTQNNESSNSNDDKQDAKDNQNNDNNNKQTQGGFLGSLSELNYTGVEKTLTVNDDVNILQGQSRESQNENSNSKSSIKVSDLKKDEIIMIWYKEYSETVENISVVQS